MTRIKLGKNMVDCSPVYENGNPVVNCSFCGDDTQDDWRKVVDHVAGKIEVLCASCLDGWIMDREDQND